MNSFSQQQLTASNDAIDNFRRGTALWGILLAQMQSGKTETYLRIACELLELKLVDFVVIFSGNSEIDLCEQVYENVKEEQRNVKNAAKKPSSFWPKYLASKEEALISVPAEYRSFALTGIKANLKEKFSVVWGTELNQYSGPTERTFFIWDEAHFAQNITQRPDKFLKKIGIAANGDSNALRQQQNLVLSVSATPFSELSDRHHLTQNKFVIKMEPGTSYVSVKQIRDSNRLRSFDNLESGLLSAFALYDPSYGPQWAVIRISKKNEDLVKDCCIASGWRFVIHDSVSKERDEGRKAWDSMHKAPKRNTVILIRGMCRMGKNMQKKHLLFVFETAKNSSTDTVLQGLLGRTCGYSEGSDRVTVFVSRKIFNPNKRENDINRYISLWDEDGVEILPRKANNLTVTKLADQKPIIPIKVKRSDLNNNRPNVIADVIKAFVEEPFRIQNKNSDINFDFQNVRVFYLDESKATRGRDKAYAIQRAFENGEARNFGSGSGTVENEVNIWCPKRISGFDSGYVYVHTNVPISEDERQLIPHTTKKEIFAHCLENGIQQESNGGFTILLSPETAIYEDIMLNELEFLVKLSEDNKNKTPSFPCSINSCYDAQNNEFKGILVNQRVYDSLTEGGKIFDGIKNKFNKTIKIENATNNSVVDGFIRLTSINW